MLAAYTPRMSLLHRYRTELELVGVTLLLKLALLGLGVVALGMITGQAVSNLHDVLGIWSRWDAPHYLDLAVLGYRAHDPGVMTIDGVARVFPGDLPLYIVFLPFFPWLVGAVNALLHDPIASAFIVSAIASLFVAPLLYQLVRADADSAVARYAAWFLLIFPTAYFLHIGYTEGLFLALVLGSFLAARRDRWWLAGLLGGLAALTRLNGLILVPALGAEAWTAWRADPARRLRLDWLAIGLVGAGFLVYLALNLVVYGDAFAFLAIQGDHWFKQLAPPWVGIGGVLNTITTPGSSDPFMLGWMEVAFIALGLIGTVVAAVRFRLSWFTWMAGNWLLFTSTTFVLSVPRYSLTLFPLFAWFGLLARRPEWAVGLSVVSIGLLGFFASQFAVGRWGF
jgi:hypothetical protein